MIIQIRGTSGSGKSTIVKEIIKLHGKERVRPVYRQDRKQPIYYKLKGPNFPATPELAIIGHYETKCGGCDTISIPGESYPIIFDLIRRNAEDGKNVLFEGLLISGDIKWSSQLKNLGLLVIELTTSLEECLQSVNDRRRARFEASGKEFTPVNPANTSAKYTLIKKGTIKLRQDFGIPVEELSREKALLRVRELVGV